MNASPNKPRRNPPGPRAETAPRRDADWQPAVSQVGNVPLGADVSDGLPSHKERGADILVRSRLRMLARAGFVQTATGDGRCFGQACPRAGHGLAEVQVLGTGTGSLRQCRLGHRPVAANRIARGIPVIGPFIMLHLALAIFLLGLLKAVAIERDVVISVYQGPCKEGDFAANLSVARQVVKQARERGSHFLAMPECFLSGYESREAVERGARGLGDADLQEFIKESATHDMVVLIGLARKAAADRYNSELVIHRGRLLGVYDKVMLTGGDRHQLGFQAGTSIPVFEAHGVRFAVIICHDSSFPHLAMAAQHQGAEILFTPHNNEIGEARIDDHRHWVRNCHIGLACQLKMAVARANIVKTDRPGQVGYGDSFIFSPQGEPLAEAKLFNTELITARITPAMFKSPYLWADLNETPSWLRTQLGQMLLSFRRPTSDADLRYWLENMAVDHGFSPGEISAATGLTPEEINASLRRFDLIARKPSRRPATEPLRVLPYPGGRHPRLGFFDGAVMPQRETKVSVFPPWDDGGYVVVDVPEAIFSNLGLTYLAHTHIPTIWTQQGIELPRLEWQRRPDRRLVSERTLPNGIAFGALVEPRHDEVRMELWLRNGAAERLTGLRVQNCVMLGAAPGFSAQTITNHVYSKPYAAVRSAGGQRWVVTAWDPCDRCWGNEQVPCLHSDPKFPDCPPGDTVRLRGWLSFYEGTDIEAELSRIEKTGWRKAEP
jgi:predicted amidohydrolase